MIGATMNWQKRSSGPIYGWIDWGVNVARAIHRSIQWMQVSIYVIAWLLRRVCNVRLSSLVIELSRRVACQGPMGVLSHFARARSFCPQISAAFDRYFVAFGEFHALQQIKEGAFLHNISLFSRFLSTPTNFACFAGRKMIAVASRSVASRNLL